MKFWLAPYVPPAATSMPGAAGGDPPSAALQTMVTVAVVSAVGHSAPVWSEATTVRTSDSLVVGQVNVMVLFVVP